MSFIINLSSTFMDLSIILHMSLPTDIFHYQSLAVYLPTDVFCHYQSLSVDLPTTFYHSRSTTICPHLSLSVITYHCLSLSVITSAFHKSCFFSLKSEMKFRRKILDPFRVSFYLCSLRLVGQKDRLCDDFCLIFVRKRHLFVHYP